MKHCIRRGGIRRISRWGNWGKPAVEEAARRGLGPAQPDAVAQAPRLIVGAGIAPAGLRRRLRAHRDSPWQGYQLVLRGETVKTIQSYMKKKKPSISPRHAESALWQWAQATALGLELMKAGIRHLEPHLSEKEVLERCRKRLRRARAGKYSPKATKSPAS